MSDRERDLFPPIDPPPGGLTRLRARLDAQTRPAGGIAIAIGVACTAVALLLVWALPQGSGPEPPASTSASGAAALHALVAGVDHPGLVSMGLAPLPSEIVSETPTSTSGIQFRRIPTTTDDVVFYMADASLRQPSGQKP